MSKLIIPLDEYLDMNKMSFKMSIKAMIEIAFSGPNQKAKEIIKRVYNINVSSNNVLKVIEFIGKIVYEHNYEEALKIWMK